MEAVGTGADRFVRLLTISSVDRGSNPDDVRLARRAGDWLLRNGWEELEPLGYVNRDKGTWFLPVVRDWLAGIKVVEYDPVTGSWPLSGTTYAARTLGHALNTLASLEIIPPRFAPLGRQALDGAAEMFEKAAAELAGQGDLDQLGEQAAVLVLQEAARSARQLAGRRVPT